MDKPKPFKLPVAFLKQLNEFTNGYYLVTITEEGKFETFMCDSMSPSQELAIINFVSIQGETLQEMLRVKAMNEALGASDEPEKEGGDESPPV